MSYEISVPKKRQLCYASVHITAIECVREKPTNIYFLFRITQMFPWDENNCSTVGNIAVQS